MEKTRDVLRNIDGLNLAIKATGSASALAKTLGVTPQTVHGWALRGRIPVDRCLQIEELLKIPRWKLRGDIWHEPENKS